MTPFDEAISWILGAEGSFVDDPRDPGGATKYGISKRAHPEVDIAALTIEQARDLYRQDYWEQLNCDQLPTALAVALFDGGVNHGLIPSVRMFQKALHTVEDGIMGPVTIDRAKHGAVEAILPNYLSYRADLYRRLGNADVYFRGWAVRLFRLQARCLAIRQQG